MAWDPMEVARGWSSIFPIFPCEITCPIFPVKCHEMPIFPGNFLTFPRYHDPVAMFLKPPRTSLRPMVQIFLPPDYSCSVLGNGTADPSNESDLFVSCRKKVGSDLEMDQYLLIRFLGGWTSIYQLFWCSPGVQGFDTHPFLTGWKCGVLLLQGDFCFVYGVLMGCSWCYNGVIVMIYLSLKDFSEVWLVKWGEPWQRI